MTMARGRYVRCDIGVCVCARCCCFEQQLAAIAVLCMPFFDAFLFCRIHTVFVWRLTGFPMKRS